MTVWQSRLLGVALLLATVGVVLRLAAHSDAADSGATSPSTADVLAKKALLDDAVARAKARLDGGPYVLRTKQVSPSEQLQVIILPEGYTEELDTRCVVYTNSELHTSAITCTGIMFRQPGPPA